MIDINKLSSCVSLTCPDADVASSLNKIASVTLTMTQVIFYCREEPAKLGEIAKPVNKDITTIQCDAYELINLGDELKDLSEYQNTEYEIPIKECPADVLTRKSED